MDCYLGNCEKCGPELLKKKLNPLSTTCTLGHVEWYSWESKGKSQKGLFANSSSITTLLDKFYSEVVVLSKHLFNAYWQYRQFQAISKSPPVNSVVTVMDFGRNYTIEYQDESQSVFYSHKQVTVHPVVCYYRCLLDSCEEVVKEDLVYLSEDIKHDVHMVNHFENKTIDHLKTSNVPFDNILQYTDGCAGQYKSCTAFSYISTNQIPVQRNYFGSRHGKGPCDQVIAVVKSAISRAVKSRQVIVNTAGDIHKFLNQKYAEKEDDQHQHHNIKFFLVPSDQVCHNKEMNVQTIPGTQKVHSVKQFPENCDYILTRNLSCFCSNCLDNNFVNCINNEYVHPWKKARLHVASTNKCKVENKKNYLRGKTFNTSPEIHLEKNHLEKTNLINERKPFFSALLHQMALCKNYEELCSLCTSYLKEIQAYPIDPVANLDILEMKDGVIDKLALELIPDDFSENRFPVLIIGDGNCLPRCSSKFIFGNEENHVEMRSRIVIEMVLNKETLTDSVLLCRGLSVKEDLVKSYVMYSDEYKFGRRISKQVIEETFIKETMSVRKAGSFMGIWQLHALSNILKRSVISVYPKYGGFTVRKHLNRKILPTIEVSSSSKEPCYIFWTNIDGKAKNGAQTILFFSFQF
ncbi:hypothetical protein SNE40_017706 [Patella caerulea]|uniref:Uncharacterized protein n=1 Tax=Patella caerulea TaxID=87958 RepID=A0AAN8JIU4_PATCE